ncbi:hypothetical protein KP509_31G021900 [Ceratopteris richardii]|uniref:Uncharacterized protein n=1 Tax=Ceratopteris richardii TaxID=49495 RepID=A0A8T2QWB0_CERRI|nr:hypothetical protein KP509_31G021900 [Ceratopteris richardii]
MRRLCSRMTSNFKYGTSEFPNTQTVIYVVDSSDIERLSNAKDEFHAILEEEEVKDVVVLVYAKKKDLSEALDDAAITEASSLHKIKSRKWAIFKTSATKGEWGLRGCHLGALVAVVATSSRSSREEQRQSFWGKGR